MPNHVQNNIRLHGDAAQIAAMRKEIQNEEAGLGSIDFQKIIPMPKSSQIE